MKINEHSLSFESDHTAIKLTYRGNENILIECAYNADGSNGEPIKILVPRHELEKFIEIIR